MNILKSVTDKNLDDESPDLLNNERNEKIYIGKIKLFPSSVNQDFIEKIKSDLTNMETNFQNKKRSDTPITYNEVIYILRI